MKKILVVAPHPDDETLGLGGTLLKHKSQGYNLNWLIVTKESGFSTEKIVCREKEIKTISKIYGFNYVCNMKLPTTRLDIIPMADMIDKIGNVFKKIKPEIVYLPYPGDVHTDHKTVFDAVIACTKWFRYDHVKRVLAYETLSETEFGINPDNNGFRPNVFVDISDYLETKIEIMKIYSSELMKFPFPRSEQAIRALAAFRGATIGHQAAEAFMLLKEIM